MQPLRLAAMQAVAPSLKVEVNPVNMHDALAASMPQ
jgi:hypothetical protein